MIAAGDSPAVLVTGASGVIGTALSQSLVSRCRRLRLLARRAWSPGCEAEVVVGDVRDAGVVAPALDGIDVVIHLAGQTSRAGDTAPAADWHANVAPLLHILDEGRRTGTVRTVMLAGSETQAGLPDRIPLDEQAPDRPLTIYDLHKLGAEQALETYVRRGLAHGSCLRLPTVFGAARVGRAKDRSSVATMVRHAVAGRPLLIYGTGDWRRDYLHVDDVVAAFLAVFDHAEAVDGRHYLLGTGQGTTLRDLVHGIADEVARQTGRPRVPVRHVDPPPGWSAIDERDVVVTADAFRRATGWAPVRDLATGLSDAVRSYVEEDGAPC